MVSQVALSHIGSWQIKASGRVLRWRRRERSHHLLMTLHLQLTEASSLRRPPAPSLPGTDVHTFMFKQICPFCTSAITSRRQTWEEEALNDLPWKDERGPLPSSTRLILEQFQGNDGKTFARQGRAHMGFAEHTVFILSWNDLSLLATPSSPIPATYVYSCRLNVWCPISMCFLRSISMSRQIQAWKEKAGPGHFRKAGSETHWDRVEEIM